MFLRYDVYVSVEIEKKINDEATTWCEENIGPHKAGWDHSYWGLWRFTREEDVVMFKMRWL